jgi:hypothetical protein
MGACVVRVSLQAIQELHKIMVLGWMSGCLRTDFGPYRGIARQGGGRPQAGGVARRNCFPGSEPPIHLQTCTLRRDAANSLAACRQLSSKICTHTYYHSSHSTPSLYTSAILPVAVYIEDMTPSELQIYGQAFDGSYVAAFSRHSRTRMPWTATKARQHF